MNTLKVGVPIPVSSSINGGGYYLQTALVREIILLQNEYPNNFDFLFIASSRSQADNFLQLYPSVSPGQILQLQNTCLDSGLSIVDKYAIRPFKRLASSRLRPSFSTLSLGKKLKASIDILWNLNPTSLSLEVPFILPVWDLQHRLQPFFPEVSEDGAWDIREEWYSKQIPRATLIVTGTERGASEICQFYGADPRKIVVIPLPMILPKLAISENKVNDIITAYRIDNPYVIYPANFWPHKNHYHLLLAIKRLKEQGLLVGVVLTGEKQGTYNSIQKLAIDLGIQAQIHFTGLVDAATLQALYIGSKGLCYPSFFGPDNLPPIEALALGLPVATADVPGAREQLHDQVLYFDPCSPSEISSAIQVMLDICSKKVINGSTTKSNYNSVTSYVSRVIDHIDVLRPYITSAHISRLMSK
jgi:glycosyltransferase involved in cell wall biosynthesis